MEAKNDLKMEGPDKDGRYSIKQTLKAGVHEYKFVINGKDWHNDPGNPDVVGKYSNSVLRIANTTSEASVKNPSESPTSRTATGLSSLQSPVSSLTH